MMLTHTSVFFSIIFSLHRLLLSVAKESNEKGGVIKFKVGLVDYYAITDPDDFTTAANQCLRRHFTYGFVKPWLGDGLISGTDVSTWRRHRKLMNPAFGQQVVHGFLHIFNAQSRNLVEDLKEEVGRGMFDHSIYFDRLSLESICQTAFGIDADEVENFDTRKFMSAVNEMLHMVTVRIQQWWLHSNVTFSISKLKRQQDDVARYLNDMSEIVLRVKRKKMSSNDDHNGTKFKAFMDLALELADKGVLTDKEVWEEMNTIIAAGYETSGSALMYTLLLLGSHVNVQNKVYEELQSVFGDSTRDVEKQDLSQLVYLEAVLKESLRVFAITPIMLRQVDNDVKLKNYTMPAGSHCLLFVCGMHRHPSWGLDVEQFVPERWLDQAALSDPDAAIYKAFAGFGVGKRFCLGKTYAMMSMKTTLVHVLRRYRVTSDVTRVKLKVDPLLKPVSGHEISLELRTNI